MPENTALTPAELTILIHHYVFAGKYPHQSSVYDEACCSFVSSGVFAPCEQQENGYLVTEFGKAWLMCILKTPKPKQVWVDSGGEVVWESSS